MSIEQVSLAFACECSSVSEKLVLVTLAWHANAEGDSCWPSVPTLMRMTCLSESPVRRALASLRKRGWIQVVKVSSGHFPTAYKLKLPLSVRHPTPVVKTPVNVSRPVAETPLPLSQRQVTPVAETPNPSSEPSLNRQSERAPARETVFRPTPKTQTPGPIPQRWTPDNPPPGARRAVRFDDLAKRIPGPADPAAALAEIERKRREAALMAETGQLPHRRS